jgi:hypothetical protein
MNTVGLRRARSPVSFVRTGKYGDSAGMGVVTCTGDCAAGYACPAASTVASPPVALCASGRYAAAGATSCSDCAAGQFSTAPAGADNVFASQVLACCSTCICSLCHWCAVPVHATQGPARCVPLAGTRPRRLPPAAGCAPQVGTAVSLRRRRTNVWDLATQDDSAVRAPPAVSAPVPAPKVMRVRRGQCPPRPFSVWPEGTAWPGPGRVPIVRRAGTAQRRAWVRHRAADHVLLATRVRLGRCLPRWLSVQPAGTV